MSLNAGFINVTRQCNVACTRCYLTEEHRSAKERLPFDVLERFLDSSFWEGSPTLVWEGGEPILVGKEMLQAYVDVARQAKPEARQTMVTNCYSTPTWAIDMAQREFGGIVETTFAMGKKFSATGSHDQYREAFLRGLNRFWEHGVKCPVNVELNSETVAAGIDALGMLILESKCRIWDFDISVDFEAFLANPGYNAATVPVLPLTVSYADGWNFLEKLRANYGQRFADAGISVGLFDQRVDSENMQFNVLFEHRFLTLNPDGTVTTDPLYSDLEDTFLGSLHHGSIDELLDSPRRKSRILDSRRRLKSCYGCQHLYFCNGGPSHVPVHDGSGECAGGKIMRDRLLSEMLG